MDETTSPQEIASIIVGDFMRSTGQRMSTPQLDQLRSSIISALINYSELRCERFRTRIANEVFRITNDRNLPPAIERMRPPGNPAYRY